MSTRSHERIGHTWHGRVRIAFASTVSGRFNPHQPGILPVLHIADENPVFDQRRLARWRAFVVESDRAAAVWQGAVIEDGHAFCGDLLAHQPGKGRSFLAVEVTFQPVADGFVQKNARPAVAKRDIHDARPCRNSFEVDQRDPQRLVRFGLPVIFSDQTVQTDAPTDNKIPDFETLLLEFSSPVCLDAVSKTVERMRQMVCDHTGGLTCSAGIASSFQLAKIASD